ncbi:MAG: glycosyltransferase family 4 protein [Anaerolineales bacterium]|nr:glycosyltransferase family 4 protein [Anaerolineales bacterium]
MKVLHVTQGYEPAIGGTEWLIQRVSEELVAQFGDEVTVFTTNCYNGEAFWTPRLPRMPTGWEKRSGVRVRRFPVLSQVSRAARLVQAPAYGFKLPGNQYLRALASGPVIPGLADAIARQPADVIAASSFPLLHMVAALRSGHRTGRPVVLAGGLHPDDDWGFGRPMIYRAIQQADAYIAYTQFEADYVIARGADPRRVHIVGTGVDLEPFAAITAEAAKARLELGSAPVIGFIGQMGHHKGLDTLLRAMPVVWQAVPEARLLIAGARTLYSNFVEAEIRSWPAAQQEKVQLIYNFEHDEKYALFRAIDVLAYPSGYESFGISYLEAWACGLPVVGCWRGAVPWVVSAGRDGLLVDYQHALQLADALVLLLSNPGWAKVLGAAGYQKVRTRYNWPEIARRFRAVYADAQAATGRDKFHLNAATE